jgi:L-fuconolactonase
LARRFPEQRFVLDHLAKPCIKDQLIEPWRTQIRDLAKSPNVCCKLSGLVTEARWRGWAREDFQPYLDVAWEAFGADRLMIGSDWPVCLLGSEYQAAVEIVMTFLQQFSAAEQEKVLGANAIRFYRLAV